ncbi:ExbD/TolR family protein [Sphingobacterium corticibacterium]|uniref:Biopolymer transporter ExbD n=1 Tax=Sphingobacterium corticibacterium TaxID=2484746 RepID=A0A4Q6XJG7_9SPHI|nr:biopolymer transporter ExbD [Sphingobacterium corticibacterium]RZF60220.1 biopolymer transporter ExbD [Sphingobacterium corticibacterium]
MAELTNDQKGGGKKERRSIRNRPMPKVDLTAMVDLAFLLITFFMLTTSLNTPHQLDIAMPDKNKGPITAPILLSEDRVLNLLLGENNELTYYRGTADSPKSSPQKVTYGKLGLGELLAKMAFDVKQATNGQDIIVLIKPGEGSIARNLVDAVDAVQRAAIGRYMITKINDVEKRMMLQCCF